MSILGLNTLVNAIKCHVALSVTEAFMLVLSMRPMLIQNLTGHIQILIMLRDLNAAQVCLMRI